MIKTFIVDDEQHCINALINQLKKYDRYRICGAAKTVEEAVELTKTLRPDLVFLDIDLGSKTGFDYLSSFLPNIHFGIIFTTAHENYSIKAIKFSALDYLLKPVHPIELEDALEKAEMHITKREKLKRLQTLEYNMKHRANGHKFIHVVTLETCHKINTKDILYLKSENSYTDFYFTDKPRITASKTLKYYTELLEGSHFFRVNKSFLVNTDRIKTYQKKSRRLILSDNSSVVVAVRRQKDFIVGNFVK